MKKSYKILLIAVATLILALLAFNFLNFRIINSTTEAEHSLSTYRTGDELPQSMTPNFSLFVDVRGQDQLAEALERALTEESGKETSIDTIDVISNLEQYDEEPILLVDLAPEKLWTPVYGHATLTAQIYFAHDGDVPWPLEEPVVFRDSPAIKADGEFTVHDTSWGLISKPAYNQHLTQALAQAIMVALETDAFSNGQ